MGDMIIQSDAFPRPVYIDDTANSTSAISFRADKTRNSNICSSIIQETTKETVNLKKADIPGENYCTPGRFLPDWPSSPVSYGVTGFVWR